VRWILSAHHGVVQPDEFMFAFKATSNNPTFGMIEAI
jgi:hypothetical protein